MKLIHTLVASLLCALPLLAMADLKVGDRFPDIEFEDQFDVKQKIEPTDTLVLMSFEKDVSEKVNEFLVKKDSEFLESNNSRYIADISGMPGLITKMFALPKMRDYNYRLLLIKEEKNTEYFEQAKGQLTVYTLKDGLIHSVKTINPAQVATVFSSEPETGDTTTNE
ncbi:hypothetical protein [Pseudoteredinibacter isoporae]|uniref:FAD/FMN-containing dehydrogenase n=1 Tax=Pseudoteredinibacter isoporae TaxID=570281 RepID=A0A7X0JYM0_9GAMM|nr:hypothetical protein [Pseudoteredinibacter isoporae]MBB6523656.1 hypothetical protein [Pseudoteredinibacter isoporae]NHO89160.1 hypothetical protein [Pseudoteredinibacter isoporae]NIB22229.1 hypothetical protein [Pseudoteredinibacter isoporae]